MSGSAFESRGWIGDIAGFVGPVEVTADDASLELDFVTQGPSLGLNFGTGVLKSWSADPAGIAGMAGIAMLGGSFVKPSQPTLASLLSFARASSATCWGPGGNLITVAANVPRIDFQPGVAGASKGLLIEGQSTNLVSNPRAEGATAGVVGSGGVMPSNGWGYSDTTGLTCTVIGTGTESNTPYIDVQISGTPSANGNPFIAVCGTVTSIAASTPYTFSGFLRLISGAFPGTGKVVVRFDEKTSAGSFITGNINSVTPTGAALATQRYAVSTTTSTTTAWAVPYFQFNVLSGVAVNFTVRIGCPQFEAQPFASSPILPVAGSPAATTRGSDFVSIPSLTPWFNPSALTLAAEASLLGFNSPMQQGIVELYGGSGNRILLRSTAATGAVRWYEVNNQSLPQNVSGTVLGTAIAGQPFKAALACGASSFQGATNGSVSSSVPSVILPGIAKLNLGADSGVPNLNGYIRRLRVWPRALSAADLQMVTS